MCPPTETRIVVTKFASTVSNNMSTTPIKVKYTKTLQHRDMNRAVTVWEDPSQKVLSQWGNIPYADWCQNESRRMNACGANTIVCQEPEGKIAICRP